MQTNRLRYGLIAAPILYGVISGCAQQGYTVIAASNTTIGVGISQQPTNGTVDATLGYKRQELAFVPTNRLGQSDQANAGGAGAQGARDTGNVIMEIRQAGIFSTSENSGIYQRLAVGDIAVKQTGAALMFAKGHDGELDADTKQALLNIAGLPSEESSVTQLKKIIRIKYQTCQKNGDTACVKKIDSAAKSINPRANSLIDFYNQNPPEKDLQTLLKSISAP